jgi:hypothetical protein
MAKRGHGEEEILRVLGDANDLRQHFCALSVRETVQRAAKTRQIGYDESPCLVGLGWVAL